MPSTRSPLALVAAFVAGAAIGAAGVMLAGDRRGNATWERIAVRAQSPDKSLVAFVRERACAEGLCRSLHLGRTAESAKELGPIATAAAEEIAWTPDGTRVAFVLNGSGLVIYDAKTQERVGTVRLMSDEASQSRLARGVTFSENGRAATFDDCPRTHSGCRAGVVGIPQ
ncbi:MAG TPA: hypothetical protein VFJ02_24010 [Vicinamibacterales bacterium]|nr:hypothetical protein [Vicinamibacterales bacterium]